MNQNTLVRRNSIDLVKLFSEWSPPPPPNKTLCQKLIMSPVPILQLIQSWTLFLQMLFFSHLLPMGSRQEPGVPPSINSPEIHLYHPPLKTIVFIHESLKSFCIQIVTPFILLISKKKFPYNAYSPPPNISSQPTIIYRLFNLIPPHQLVFIPVLRITP